MKLFENILSKEKIWFFNTHFDHIGNDARKNSTDLILKMIKNINSNNIPLILTGDFNLEDDDSSIKKIQKQLIDVLINIEKSNDYYGTYNGFNNKLISQKRIDYIFIKNLKLKKARHVHLQTPSKSWASDHHPVLSILKI